MQDVTLSTPNKVRPSPQPVAKKNRSNFKATSSLENIHTTSVSTAKMDTPGPVKVGTRGTVGSLIRKEMEYYRQLERNLVMSTSNKVDKSCGPSGLGKSWLRFKLLIWKRSKKKKSGRFLPKFCSFSKVADPQQQFNSLASFSYRNLKDQAKD